MNFSIFEYSLIFLIFLWTGFVRAGLGFGGAALGLPLLLLVGGTALDWLPIIGLHLLFFAALVLSKHLNRVDWDYLKKSALWILPAAMLGILGLVNFADKIVAFLIFAITIFYAVLWIFDRTLTARSRFMDKFLLFFGGYVAGTSLTGAPLIVAVYAEKIHAELLRNTLFVLWFILVSMKMLAFVALDVAINWRLALVLLPVAALGHIFGLRMHAKIATDRRFKKWVGSVLLLVCVVGLFKLFFG